MLRCVNLGPEDEPEDHINSDEPEGDLNNDESKVDLDTDMETFCEEKTVLDGPNYDDPLNIEEAAKEVQHSDVDSTPIRLSERSGFFFVI